MYGASDPLVQSVRPQDLPLGTADQPFDVPVRFVRQILICTIKLIETVDVIRHALEAPTP